MKLFLIKQEFLTKSFKRSVMRMYHVTIKGVDYTVEAGTTFQELADKVQKKGEPVILLAYVNGKLKELFQPV